MKKMKIMMSKGFTRRDALKLYGVALGALVTRNPKSAFGTNNELKMTLPREEIMNTKPSQSESDNKVKKLLIINSQLGEPYTSSSKVIIAQLEKLGYKEQENLSISQHSIQNKEDLGVQILTRSTDYDVCLTNGTIANISAFKCGFKKPQYKFVFCNLTDPVGIGVVKALDEPTDSNFTGIGYTIPVIERLRFLRDVMPHAKKIGMIYADMPQSHGYLKWLNDSLKLEEFSDMELILEKVEFVKGEEGSIQMAKLAKDFILSLNEKVDVFMTPSDQMGTQRYFAETVAEFGIKPLMGLSQKEITEDWGACFAVYMDPDLAYKETAEMIKKLFQGQNIKDIIPQSPKARYGLNLKRIKKFNMSISDSILKKANDIV